MFLKRFMGGAAVSALTLAMSAPAVMAQETTSQLRGGVVSTDGEPIVGAKVTITHVPTGSRQVQTTNSVGAFDQRGLRPGGPYIVEFEAQDYRGERVEDVFLRVGEPARLNVDLEPTFGEIVVIATPPRSNAVGSATVLGRDSIESVVAINRDIRELARRDPLVSQNTRGDGGISIAGSNPRTNRITIDGVQAQDDFGLNTGGLPTRRGPVSIDAVEQFAVEAVPFDVENGDFLGGAINVVLRGGTNEFDGSVFVNYLNDGFAGERIRDREIVSAISQKNYGGTLRGPIIPNALFFALSYETYESFDATTTGPVGQGFATEITGPSGAPRSLTLADISAVTNIFSATYGSNFPAGSIPATKPITDEKLTAKIDWDITDDHRATFTYRTSESGVIQRTNLSTTSAGLDSQWYLTGEEDKTYSVQLNSDWTDALSTEIRLSKRDYARAQAPPSGQNFADIRVCTTETNLDAAGQSNPLITCRNGANTAGVVRFGPDQFRHANELETTNTQAQASAEYATGAHLFKVGGQWQRQEVFNLFVPQSDGVYYFDSLADFRAGRVNELVYRNALTGNPRDAAAVFEYDVFTLFAQDSWDLNDMLTLNLGVRYDTYTVDAKPALNPNYRTRTGKSNQTTYDGLDVIMPRFSFVARPLDDLKISGGVGLFSGGVPDVFLSNAFSNTGILDNSVRFIRNADGTFSETSGSAGFTQAIGAAALNVPVTAQFGRAIPTAVQAFLAGAGAPVASEVNALAPDFEMPSDWRMNLAAEYDIAGWQLGFNTVYVRSQQALAFRDLRAQPLIINGQRALTPDGRVRYDGLNTAQRTSITGVQAVPANIPTSGGAVSSNRDLETYNPDEENTIWTTSFSVGREWDNGLSFGLSYTYQDAEEFSASSRFSSTQSSLYGGQFAALDPNTAVLGDSQEEIEHNVKAEFGWRKEFVEGLETRFSLFGESRTGRPVSFTMNGGSGRNATFGVNRGAQMAYVPNLTGTTSSTPVTVGTTTTPVWRISSDSRVVFDSAASITNLQNMVRRFDIPTGGIVPRGSFRNQDITQVDFQISQELPAFFEGNRALITLDIANFGNLLNTEWGVVEEFPEDFRLFDVTCAGADGVADNDGVATCSTYRISSVNTTQGASQNTDESRWFIQIGLRYEF